MMLRPDATILVTGANGFIGSHLVEALLARGRHVRCMVRRSSDLRYLRHLPVEWAYADITDAGALREACRGADAVCHCAALTRARDEQTYLRVNADAARALAQASLETCPNLARFVFVSSVAAVGPSQDSADYVDESRRPAPITWYGHSKWKAEQALLAMRGSLPITIVRPAPVFGPRDRDFLPYFALVKRGLNLQVGSAERWVSMIYVHDLVDLILRAVEDEAAVGETFMGCGQAITRGELGRSIARAFRRRALYLRLPLATLAPIGWISELLEKLTGRSALLNRQKLLDIGAEHWLCSGEKARRVLGFAARFDLDRAVGETAAWYQSNGWL